MPLSRYSKMFSHPDDPGLIMLFSTRTTSVLTVPAGMIGDIEQGMLSDEEKETLTAHGVIVESLENEMQEMLGYIDEMNRLSKSFCAIVVMSLDCNLACRYCFEGTRKGKYYLSADTAGDLVDFVGRNIEGSDEIDLVFYGGEPLLSTDLILRMSEKLATLAQKRGMKYGFSLITNGTLLTRRAAEQLKGMGLRSARVTLDGPSEVHDRSRPFKSGTGSFNTIIRHVQDACEVIDIHVNGNFTEANYRAFPELLDILIESGLGPDRISSIGFFPVMNESGQFSPDFHEGCYSSNEPWLAEAGNFLRQEILQRGFRTDEVQPSVCMFERQDHLVVNWDGGLYKCPGLIGRKEFCAGSLNAGLGDYAVTHNLGNWKNEECLACVYLPLCFGGCRYMKLMQSGNILGVDCRKDYFDRTLQALVLQDVIYRKTAAP